MSESADPRMTFGRVADIYHEVRPGYPPALFDDLFASVETEAPIEVVEVGPGTGQATRSLLERGARVHAIELSPPMAAKLRETIPDENLTITVADFESNWESDSSAGHADVVFSATAYHWISPPAQTGRPAQLLRPGGLVAIVDPIQVDSADDQGFFDAAQPIYDRYGQGHTGPPAPAREAVDPAIADAFRGDDRYGDVTVRRYDWNQTYSTAQYRSLMLSYSGTGMMSEPDRIGLLDDIGSLIEQGFGGRVTRPLVVTLTTARLVV